MPDTGERAAMPGDVLLRDYAYSTYVYRPKVHEGEDIDMCKRPSFWAHLAKKLRPGDVIQLLADDGSFEWHGRVLRTGAVEAHLREIFIWKADPEAVESKPDAVTYDVGWGGPNHKWRVTNSRDEVIKHSFNDEATAAQWLADYKAGRIRQAA